MSSSALIFSGSVNVIKSEVTMSLVLLKEASYIVSKVPFLPPLAGLLLNIFQVCDEVQQGQNEWALVMQRLVDIAGLVISAGRSCERVGKEDLAHLQVDLQHLQRELERTAGVLKECAVSSRIKKVFMRKDILSKIKQCDRMLTHVHSVFQTKMSLHIHFRQLTQCREVMDEGSLMIAPITDNDEEDNDEDENMNDSEEAGNYAKWRGDDDNDSDDAGDDDNDGDNIGDHDGDDSDNGGEEVSDEDENVNDSEEAGSYAKCSGDDDSNSGDEGDEDDDGDNIGDHDGNDSDGGEEVNDEDENVNDSEWASNYVKHSGDDDSDSDDGGDDDDDGDNIGDHDSDDGDNGSDGDNVEGDNSDIGNSEDDDDESHEHVDEEDESDECSQ